MQGYVMWNGLNTHVQILHARNDQYMILDGDAKWNDVTYYSRTSWVYRLLSIYKMLNYI